MKYLSNLKNSIKQTSLFVFAVFSALIMQSSAFASGLLTAKGSNDNLQIQDHSVTVSIEDGYAITTVENTFYNPSNQDLEAVYEFPVPKNGTIAEFTVWIDGKPIIGEVLEKQKAKQLYEQEKTAGRDAGLTEKKSFFRFESSVSPVRAQQNTKTRIVYIQPADIEGGIGRYVYPLEEGGTDQEKIDFWQTNDKVHGAFSFDLNLRSGFPIDALRSPAHPQAVINAENPNEWKLSINQNGKVSQTTTQQTTTGQTAPEPSERESAFSDLKNEQESIEINSVEKGQSSRVNQDIVIYWRLSPNQPGGIELVTHKEANKRRGTFMLTVTPGVDLQAITEGRDWVFVLDRSGSMQSKYATLMDATSEALKKLGQKDRFKVVLFNNYVEELSSGWMDTSNQDIATISKRLSKSQPNGGTNMYAGISAATNSLDSDRTSSIVLITDGVANVGKTEKKDFLDLLKKHDVRLFTAIMGNGANQPLLDSMTKASKGFSTNISNSDDIMGVMVSALGKVKYEALHDVELKIKGVKTSDIITSNASTVYRGQQMVMFGHYFGKGNAEFSLNAKISGEDKEYRSQFTLPEESTDNPEIERLWAYAAIKELKDKTQYLGTNLDDHRSAIVDLATEYGLVTDYTSMIVMNEEQFEKNGIQRLNKQRRKKEESSAQARRTKPVASKRVDTQKPAFQHKQPSYSHNTNSSSGGNSNSGGSGAINPLSIVMLLPLFIAWLRRRASVQANRQQKLSSDK